MGGRINVLEIPNHLGVNIEVIEKSLENIVKKSKVTLINGQLIAPSYLDFIMEELYESVSERGQIIL
jgi:hypothetical protein